jgi:aryl-alcohol dehydrogenase-like predicted oxidoreductase
MSDKRYELAGKMVSRVGFGAMQLGDVNDREGPPAEWAKAILRNAIAAGVDHIDTAQFYGGGEVNRRIRTALAPYPDDLLIATKIGAVEKPDGSLTPAQKPAELRAQVEENLTGLGVEALDLVYLRRVDAAPGFVAEGDQIVDLDAQLEELAALRDAGKVRALGLSHVSREQVERGIAAGIVAVQNWYGVLNR